MRRVVLVVACVTAVSLPVSLAAVSLSTPAGAASGVACKKLSGSISGSFTVTKCTPKSSKNKKATGMSSSLATGSGTITWSPSHGTTTVTLSETQSGTSCPAGSSEYMVTGSVTGGTSTYTSSGDAISGDVCLKGTKLSLVKGTSLTL